MFITWETMSLETETATPVEQLDAEQVLDPVESTPEATTEHVEQTQEQAEEDAAKKVPGIQKRIDELTKEKYRYKRDAEQAAAEAQAVREQLARLQQGDTTPQAQDVESRVKHEAAKIVAEQSFNDACNKVYATGKAEFPDFDAAVANLQMVGVNRDFLELATTSDAGARLLNHLGQANHLDEAARIANLPPVQMARELTRLEFKLAQTQTKPVSKAPAPIKPIGAGGATDSDLRDDLPLDEWLRRRNAQRKR